MPNSEADRANIIATRYERLWLFSGPACESSDHNRSVKCEAKKALQALSPEIFLTEYFY